MRLPISGHYNVIYNLPALNQFITDMGKLRPVGQIRPAGFFILPAGTYTNLNSHRKLSGEPFFPFEIMDGSDFQKNKPQGCKIGIKSEVKAFYFGDHIRTWTVISTKRVLFSCFRISVRPAFSKSGLSCEKLAHPWFKASLYSTTLVTGIYDGTKYYKIAGKINFCDCHQRL